MLDDGNQPEIVDSRRRFLALLGAGGVAGLAGCNGNNSSKSSTGTSNGGTSKSNGGGTSSGSSSTSADGSASFVSKATFKTYMNTAPGDSSVTWNPYQFRNQWPRLLFPLVMDRKAAQMETTGELVPLAITKWSHDDSTIKFQIHDKANWSDGKPVVGKDLGIPLMLSRMQSDRSPSDIKNSSDGPQSADEAITNVTWAKKSLTVHSDPGWFGQFYMDEYVQNMLIHAGSASIATRAEDFLPNASVKGFQEIYDEVKDDPWSDASKKKVKDWNKSLIHFVPKTDPSKFPTSGPFSIKDVRSDKVILEKNKHFRAADKINWPTVEVQVISSERAIDAALKSDILDGTTGLLHLPKANVIDTFPKDLKYFRHTGNAPNGLFANPQKVKWLGNWRVRQAMAYALNKPQIAQVINKDAATAPQHPPGLMRADGRKWVPKSKRSGFNQYKFNTGKATKLMKDAGFKKKNGTWYTSGGDKTTLELLTGGKTVQVESVVISQLNDFGFDVKLKKQSSTTVSNRVDKGDFQLTLNTWPTNPQGLYFRDLQQSTRRHLFGTWSDKAVNKWVDSHDNIINKEYDWTNNVEGFKTDQTKNWTLSAPPVGQPNGKMKQYPVVYDGLLWQQNISKSKRQKIMTDLAWVFNWNLTYIPFAREFQLAFQDTKHWNVPSDKNEWKQYGPQYRLLLEGKIQANPDAF